MIALGLASCESYEPLPLEDHPRLAAPAGFDPAKPLDMAEIARLAVENNPDLRAARGDRGIAQAQVIQAGILPNPQVSASLGLLAGGPASADSWSAGIGQDIKALITFQAQKNSARLDARKIDADLLWQEWQVMAKARLLFVDTVEQGRSRALLAENRALFADRYKRTERAVRDGNAVIATLAPDLTALSDIDKQLADLDRQAETRRHDLAVLLGLDPSVSVTLAPDIAIALPEPAAITELLPRLPNRRPDLIALKFGYGSEEEKMRAAILGQFPALIFGGSAGSDTSNVLTAGPAITFDLPIFNRNQGAIAIERATRQRLHDEYTARLTASVAEIKGLLAQQELLRRQLGEAKLRLGEAEQVAELSRKAYDAGNLDERSYVDLAVTLIAKRQEIIGIEQLLAEGQVAIQSLIGTDMEIKE